MSNITLNIVEPGSAPVVPDTGLFTAGIGGPEATIITVSTILVLALVAAIVWYFKKHTNLRITNITKHIKAKKSIAIGLTVLAILVSAGTFASLLVNAGKSNTNAVEGEDDSSLTVDVSSEELTIEVGSEPVFAVLPVDIIVEEEMPAGYTLTAYTDSTDLVSTTDESKTIPMIAVDEGELATLTDNTYGLALAEPESQDEEVYTALSTDADNPTFITDKDYEHTDPNDTTTIYYGFYITPDTPYGTYTSGYVYYDVEANPLLATIVYNGKGLYFNGDDTQTTNTVRYDIVTTTKTSKISHTPNVSDDGAKMEPVSYGTTTNEVVTIPGASRLSVSLTYGSYSVNYGFAALWSGSHPDWTADGKYRDGIQSCDGSTVADGRFGGGGSNATVTATCSVNSDTVTFAYWAKPGGGPSIGYGYYAVVTGYDDSGNIVYLKENSPMVGEYLIPSYEAPSKFIGWATSEEATTPTYTTEESIEKELSLTLGKTTQLYAIWEPAFAIAYNGNGADSATKMDNVEQYTAKLDGTSQVDLLASNFTREGYGFAGWSADSNAWEDLKDNDTTNDPIIYGPNQTITIGEDVIAEAGENRRLILNAVWVPVAKNNEEPVELQNWQGCSGLTATTYSNGVLTVGKNTVTALKDGRDGNIYTVARLADGNCWMVENLRLDSDAAISTTNTYNPVVVNDKVAIINNDGNTSAHLSPTNNNWCTNWSSECYDQSYLNTNNTTLTTNSPVFSQDFTSSSHSSNFDTNIVSYGNYYNWYSATAGNGVYEKASGDTDGDICPKGWRLPTGGDNGEFKALNQQMGGGTSATDSNNWRSFPNNFVYSSFWNGSSTFNRGGGGNYTSSTTSGKIGAYLLILSSTSVSPDYSSAASFGKFGGNSVRCVASGQ